MPGRVLTRDARAKPASRQAAQAVRVKRGPFLPVTTPLARPPRQNMVMDTEKVTEVWALLQPNSASRGARKTLQA